jgi:Pectate lyase superfamily protein
VAEHAPDRFLYEARANGLAGDGNTNDQPALQALVDRLGDEYAVDGQARTIYCPSGRYSIRNRPTVWRSGVSLVGAGPAATTFVLANDDTELSLAPVRPGATTAWPEGTPSPGTRYRLPDAPAVRAGVTAAAAVHSPTIHDNRVWDAQARPTQTHGLVVTAVGVCGSAWVHDNDCAANAVAPVRFDTEPSGGCWHHNHGIDECPGGGRPAGHGNDGQSRSTNGGLR